MGLPLQLNTDLASFAESDEPAFLNHEALQLAQELPESDGGVIATSGDDDDDLEYEPRSPHDTPLWMRTLQAAEDNYGERFELLDEIVLFFRAERGSIFDPVALKEIRRIERGLEALDGWTSVCRAETYTSQICMRPKSVTNLFFPSRDAR
jgi:hypothetical protein